MKMISILIRSFKLSLDYHKVDTKLEYFIFASFQIVWYSVYFFWLSGDSFSLILTALFIVPLVSSSLRCLNYVNRTRSLGFLWLFSPYIMLFLPLILTKKK